MTRNELIEVLKRNIKAVIPGLDGREVLESSSLVHDYGADSLQIVEIVSRTMRAASVKVKRTELNKAKNVGELLDLLRGGVQ